MWGDVWCGVMCSVGSTHHAGWCKTMGKTVGYCCPVQYSVCWLQNSINNNKGAYKFPAPTAHLTTIAYQSTFVRTTKHTPIHPCIYAHCVSIKRTIKQCLIQLGQHDVPVVPRLVGQRVEWDLVTDLPLLQVLFKKQTQIDASCVGRVD